MEKKYICLSFDDGPNLGDDHTMNDMLDLLEKFNIKASFFLIGNKITEENKAVIKRAVEMGCDIQNHTWTHPDMTKLSEEEILEEYKKCDDAITEITGKRPEFFRPPYISVNDKMHECIKTPFICGRGCNDWDFSFDAEYRTKHLIEEAEDGEIALLHVMEGNIATLKAVETAVPELKKRGFEFVNLPELFELRNKSGKYAQPMWSIVN